MSMKKVIWMFAALIVFTCIVAAQDQAPAQTTKTIQHTPIQATSAASGEQMYKTYCAVCHGNDGRGAGPAAPAMKVPPTDLTLLAKNHGGKYPGLEVASSIDGEANLPAHGSREMPVWGQLFWGMSDGHEAEVTATHGQSHQIY